MAATGAGEVEVRLDLAADALDPAGHHVGLVEGALALFLGVADLSGGAADQQQRPVPGELQPARGQDLHQVADVQARRGRVEADIERHRPARQMRAQLVEAGGVLHQAPPQQIVDDVGHAPIVAHRRARAATGSPRHYPEPLTGPVRRMGDREAGGGEVARKAGANEILRIKGAAAQLRRAARVAGCEPVAALGPDLRGRRAKRRRQDDPAALRGRHHQAGCRRDPAAGSGRQRGRPAHPGRGGERARRHRLLPRPVGGRAPGAHGLHPRHPGPGDGGGGDAGRAQPRRARDQVPPTLSSGQRRRLALASCFVRPRRLLVLDEPEQRLDAAGREWLTERLRREKAERRGGADGVARPRARGGDGRRPAPDRRRSAIANAPVWTVPPAADVRAALRQNRRATATDARATCSPTCTCSRSWPCSTAAARRCRPAPSAQPLTGPAGSASQRAWLVIGLSSLIALLWRGLRMVGPLVTTPAAQAARLDPGRPGRLADHSTVVAVRLRRLSVGWWSAWPRRGPD